MKNTLGIDYVLSESNIDFRLHRFMGAEEEHDHQFMEIEYIVKGNLTQIINGKKVECNEGDFLFFYVGDSHQLIAQEDKEVEIHNLIFHPKLFDDMMLRKFFPIDKRIQTVVKLPSAERKKLKSIFVMMKKEFAKKDDGYVCVLHSLLQSMICILLRYGYRKEGFDDRVQQIINFIEEDITLSVSQVADKCGFCTNHIERIFRKNIGLTINEYIIKKKVERAYNLIKTTNLSVESIMEQINLSNKTYFYKILKKHTGKTPGQLRGNKTITIRGGV